MTKSLKISLVALFVIVDVVAVAFTIRHVNQRPVAQQISRVLPTESTSTPDAGPEAAAETAAPQSPADGLVISGTTMVRYAAGSCDAPGEAELAVAADPAAAFTSVRLPLEAKAGADGHRDAAVSSILNVAVTTAKEFSLIGTDLDCNAQRYTTDDGGDHWTRADAVDDWYVANLAVMTPAGPSDVGCEALSVWAISDRNARVACRNGQIRGTDDGGTGWVGLGSLDGLEAASFSTIHDGFAIAKDIDCEARAFSTAAAGGQWQPLGCISTDNTGTAISGGAGLLGAVVDGAVYVSTDQGTTWKRS